MVHVPDVGIVPGGAGQSFVCENSEETAIWQKVKGPDPPLVTVMDLGALD
jgi:hypothetical protein